MGQWRYYSELTTFPFKKFVVLLGTSYSMIAHILK